MKKLVVFVAALLLVAVLVAPLLIGFALERQMRTQIAELPAVAMIDASLPQYDRGWFSSRVVARVGIGRFFERIIRQQAELNARQQGIPLDEEALREQIENPDFPLDLDFVTEVRHGPFTSFSELRPVMARTVTTLSRDTPGLADLEDALGVDALFTSEAIYELTGLIRSSFNTPTIRVENESARSHVAAARMDATYSSLTGATEITGHFPLAEFDAESTSGRIEGIAVEMSGQMVDAQLFDGTSFITVERVGMSLPDEAQGSVNRFELVGMTVDSATRVSDDEETLSIRYGWQVDRASLSNLGLMEDAEFATTFDSVDLALIRTWTQLSNELALGTPPEDPSAIFAELGPALETALRHSPRLALDPIRATIGGDEVELSLRVGIDGDRLPEGSITDDPVALLNAASGEIDVRVPRWVALQIARSQLEAQANAAVEQGQASREQANAWLEQQSVAMLDQYVIQNLVKLGADGYRTQLSLEDGVVSVNGEPLPVDLKAMIEAAAEAQAGPSV